MKTLKCDLCDHQAQGETFDEWMEEMKPHYAKAHADFMQQQGNKTEDEQRAGMIKWIADNHARFDTA
ncbi:MAG: hypothetical protein COU69_03235 [Candidatus Pacebacteria bacterium CG10_big_fil_rev_8_21_14_0_10_56_10]|nr:MAG: hypothetical protein COU69_03235 [Candidatus Pacebacteria bacterium CG10_big_fil_rev_8_21_14_0_10_56_10]